MAGEFLRLKSWRFRSLNLDRYQSPYGIARGFQLLLRILEPTKYLRGDS